ncbi:MAG: hypothetical protein ACLVAO_03475 [Clostridium fessum]
MIKGAAERTIKRSLGGVHRDFVFDEIVVNPFTVQEKRKHGKPRLIYVIKKISVTGSFPFEEWLTIGECHFSVIKSILS